MADLSREQVRRELAADVALFQRKGHEIEEVPPGATGVTPRDFRSTRNRLFRKPEARE